MAHPSTSTPSSTLLLSIFLLFGLIFISYASASANANDDGGHHIGIQDPPIQHPTSEPYVDVKHGGYRADDEVGEDDDSGGNDGHRYAEFQNPSIPSTIKYSSSEPNINVAKPAWHGGHYADDDVGDDDDTDDDGDDQSDEIRHGDADGDDDEPTTSYIAIPTPTPAPTPKPRRSRPTKPTPRPKTTKPKPKPKQKRAPRATGGRVPRPKPNPYDEFDPSQATKPQPAPPTTVAKNSTQNSTTAINNTVPFSGVVTPAPPGIIKHRRIKA